MDLFPSIAATQQTGVCPAQIPDLYTQDEEQKIKTWQRQLNLQHAMTLYQPVDDTPEEQAFQGLTNLQVRNIRVWREATKNPPQRWAVEFVQDHTFGKAVQRVETASVHMTYQDLLASVRQAEERYQDVVVLDPDQPTAPDVPSTSSATTSGSSEKDQLEMEWERLL